MSTADIAPPRVETARVRVGRLEPAALAGVMSRDVSIFGRYWKATTFSSIVQPTIYLLAFAVAMAVVLVGVLAMLLRSRLAVIVPAVAGILAAVLLILPLSTWAAGHTERYPLGADNIPRSSPADQFLRGEWEQSAKTTAEQIGSVVIVIGLAAILLTVALDVRRRSGRGAYIPPPPPAIAGEPAISSGLELEGADSDLARGNRPGRWRN